MAVVFPKVSQNPSSDEEEEAGGKAVRGKTLGRAADNYLVTLCAIPGIWEPGANATQVDRPIYCIALNVVSQLGRMSLLYQQCDFRLSKVSS
jgi:hypothetical protein